MQSYSDSDLGLSVLNTKAGESKVELTLQKDQNFVQIDKTETEEIDPFEYGIELSGEILKLDTSAGIVGYSMEYIAKYNLFIVGTKDGSILVYDSSSFHLLEKLASVHKGWIISLTYSPALNLLFSTSSDRLIKIFQPESKNIIELTKLEGHKDNVNAVLVDEKNLLLFSCGRDPDIKIWDLDSYSLKDIISTGEGKMGCAILNIEEKNCIGVSFFTGEIRFYNIETKLCIFTLETGVSSYYINSLLYLPKKKFIIAQISSKEIKIWKMINEELNEFTVYGTIKSEGHANFVYVDKKEESIVFACDKPFLDVFDLNSLLRKNKIHFSETPLKNSNGLLLIPSLSKIIVSAWNSPHLYILKYDSLSV